jgi:hypothetical protein
MKHPILGPVILLWVASLACNRSGTVAPPDPNAAQTAIVETIMAIQAQPATTAVNPVEATPTLELPTALPSASPTPEFTTTPVTPQISVSFDTFCRTGPGKDYEKVGILLVGETTEIVGRHATGQFWYVRNPDVGPEFCWVSGEYATISGNTLVLLVQTPASAPATDFEITYLGMGQCSGAFWSDIRLKNLSDAVFESMRLTIKDLDTSTFHDVSANDFTFTDGCGGSRSVDSLDQGGAVMISTPDFSYNLNAHNISVTITLCTDADFRGSCVTKSISYKP